MKKSVGRYLKFPLRGSDDANRQLDPDMDTMEIVAHYA
jgi:hypothetical protein